MSLIDGFVDADDRRIADAVRSLPTRPDDAAVQHPGHAHMLHVLDRCPDLLGDVGARNARADDAVVVPPLGDGVVEAFARKLDAALVGHWLELAIERFASQQLGVGD